MPLKPFGSGKQRLGAVLRPAERAKVVEAVAARLLEVIQVARLKVGVVTADRAVAGWAEAAGAEVIGEPENEPPGLDRAARAGLRWARDHGSAWVIVHGDLPLVGPDDFRAVAEAIPRAGLLLAPSYDGGTNLLAGDVDEFHFSYGPGSFRRHLAAAGGRVRIMVRPALALDLDSERDLAAVDFR